jgi:hypothetical protein
MIISASPGAEEAFDRLKRRRVGLAVHGLSALHAPDQTGLAQLLDVVGHSRERQVELARQRGNAPLEILNRRLLALADQLIDGEPIRIGQGPEHHR